MKRVIMLILTCAFCVSMCVFPASAKEPENVEVSVDYYDIAQADILGVGANNETNIDTGNTGIAARRQVIRDLSERGVTFEWTIPAESAVRSVNLYKTNSTKIYVNFVTDIKASIKVELLDGSGTSLNEKTVTVDPDDERVASVKFTNLTSSKSYHIRMENLSQKKVVVSGAIKDSLI